MVWITAGCVDWRPIRKGLSEPITDNSGTLAAPRMLKIRYSRRCGRAAADETAEVSSTSGPARLHHLMSTLTRLYRKGLVRESRPDAATPTAEMERPPIRQAMTELLGAARPGDNHRFVSSLPPEDERSLQRLVRKKKS